MAAFLIANVEVESPAEYQEYVSRNTAVVQQYGGRFVVRGGQLDLLEGEFDAHRLVLIEFESAEAAHAWYSSLEYQAIKPIRQKYAHTHLLGILY